MYSIYGCGVWASSLTVFVSHWSPTISPHGRCCICATSLIHLLATSLLPSTTGQPPWSIAMSLAPDLLMLSFKFYLFFLILEVTLMLCQKMAAPSSGLAATPRRGKAVMPPEGQITSSPSPSTSSKMPPAGMLER